MPPNTPSFRGTEGLLAPLLLSLISKVYFPLSLFQYLGKERGLLPPDQMMPGVPQSMFKGATAAMLEAG